MKKNSSYLILLSLILAACGSSDEKSYFGNDKSVNETPPLADNPPISADDLDAIVEEEKKNKVTK